MATKSVDDWILERLSPIYPIPTDIGPDVGSVQELLLRWWAAEGNTGRPTNQKLYDRYNLAGAVGASLQDKAYDFWSNGLLKSGVRLPGTSGNYISTPDSVINSVTGDIDIRAYIRPDAWVTAANQVIGGKWGGTNQRGYRLYISTTGGIVLNLSTDGTATTVISISASYAQIGSPANAAGLWVRATLDVDDGAGNRVGKVYTSPDGVTWTLASTNTTAGVINLFDSTMPLVLGMHGDGTIEGFVGTIYYAEVRNGIDGPIVAKFDSSATQVTGTQLPATIPGWTWNGSALYKRDDYVRFPGVATNVLNYPDVANVYGDIDLRIKVSFDNTTGTFGLLSKSQTSGQNSWRWRFINNTLELGYYLDGTNLANAPTTGALGVVAGVPIWLRTTRVKSTGVVVFYTSPDGVTWTTVATSAPVDVGLSLFDGTSPLELGARFTSVDPLAGNVYYAEVRNGIGGTVVAYYNGADNQIQTPWTINGSGWNWEGAAFQGKPGIAVAIPGPSGNYITTPDTPALPTGDIDIRAKVAPDTWTPVTVNGQTIVGRFLTSGQRSFAFNIATSGNLEFVTSQDGTTQNFGNRGSGGFNTARANGQPLWVRVTRTSADGVTQFYYSTDGAAWTPIGTSVVIAAATGLFDSTDPLYIGTNNNAGGRQFEGKIYYVEVRNGIDGPIVAKFNPTNIAKTGTRTPTTTVQPGGTPNMLTPNQASIETDASGYFAGDANTTLAQSAAQFLDGTKSLSLTAIAIGKTSAATTNYALAGVVPVVAGKMYTGTISSKAGTTARTITMFVEWLNAAGGFLGSTSGVSVVNSAAGWTVHTDGGKAPAGAVYADIFFKVDDAAQAAGEVHFFDRASLVEAAEVWTMNGSAWDWIAA